MIVGTNGVIGLNPVEMPEAARKVQAEFEMIPRLPVRAIIYNHGLRDNTGGETTFYAPARGIEVWDRGNFGLGMACGGCVGMGGGLWPRTPRGSTCLRSMALAWESRSRHRAEPRTSASPQR